MKNQIWKPLPSAAKYEIDSRGAIRRAKDKSPVFTDKTNNAVIYADDGNRITINSIELTKQLFDVNIPAGTDERENSAKPDKTKTAKAEKKNVVVDSGGAMKSIDDRTARAKKMTMPTEIVTKEEKKAEKKKNTLTPVQTSATDAKIKKISSLTCKKYQRIWLLYSAGVEKSEIMKIASANAGEVFNAIKVVSSDKNKQEAANILLS